MKRADLQLDTVYADRDDSPLVVIRTDAVVLTDGGWHSSPSIRTPDKFDKPSSHRVLVVKASYRSGRGADAVTVEDLLDEARRLRDEPIAEETHGRIEVRAVTLAAVVKNWDDHLIAMQMQRDAEQEKRRRIAAERAARAESIAELRTLLPDWFTLTAHDDRDHVQVPLADLLALMRSVERR